MSGTADMERLRATLRAFCPTGHDREAVTTSDLAAVMGLQPNEKQRLRNRIRDLLRRGEVRKTDNGGYVHVPGNEPNRYEESCGRIWRAVHVQGAPFTVQKIAQISRYSLVPVYQYLSLLLQDGFIKSAKREGPARRYAVTSKGKAFRDIPYPHPQFSDPTEVERVTCWKLMKLYHEDVTAPAIREQIRQHLITLNARFKGRKQESANVEQEN